MAHLVEKPIMHKGFKGFDFSQDQTGSWLLRSMSFVIQVHLYGSMTEFCKSNFVFHVFLGQGCNVYCILYGHKLSIMLNICLCS